MDPVTRDRSTRPVVAAFDVDKTLTTRDCVVPFLWKVGGPVLVVRLLPRIPQLLVAVLRRRRDRIKAIATRAAVRGIPLSRIDIVACRYADQVWARRMRPDTVARLNWHVKQGHHVVLVSASYRNYLEPLAARLGVRGVISTELEVRDGICTGGLLGPNCRATVKPERLRAWMDAEGLSGAVIHAYGDSAGDRDLLALADHPTLVGTSVIAVSPEFVSSGSSFEQSSPGGPS